MQAVSRAAKLQIFFHFFILANSGKLAHIRLIGTSLLKRQLNLHEIYIEELFANYRPN